MGEVRLKQDAEKQERAGRLEQALELYKQVGRHNPDDSAIFKKIGDLHLRLNRVGEAAAQYGRLAERWTREGFLLRAIAMWKQVSRLDPGDPGPLAKLADLYARQGLVGDAREHGRAAFEEYLRRGRVREAEEVLERMAGFDPNDLEVRARLIDLHVRRGQSRSAATECIAVARELAVLGQRAAALRLLEKAAKIDPQSPEVRLEEQRLTAREEGDSPLPPALPADPEDEEFVKERLDTAEMLRRYGLADKAAEQLEAILARFPGHPLAQRALERTRKENGGTALSDDAEVGPTPPAPHPVDQDFLGLPDDALEPAEAAPVEDDELIDFVLDEDDLERPPPLPASPRESEFLAELEQLLDGALGGATPPHDADLERDLDHHLLAETVREFREGVDRLVGRDDYETRYNLGIAYKEMGLLDEAIAEFELVARSETRLFESASMLGHCFMEKGMPELAVGWLERGLAASGRSEDEYRALRCDLAAARDASGA